MSGYYVMMRGWMDHPAFAKEPFTEREAFEWLVGEAAYAPCRRRIGTEVACLDRGQLGASLRFLCRAWRWKSDKRVRGFLSRMEDEGMIFVGKIGGQKWTQITICNYDKFQLGGRSEDAARTQRGRKLKEDKNPSSLRSEGDVDARETFRGDAVPVEDRGEGGAPAGADPEGGASASKPKQERGAYLSEDWHPRDSEIQFALDVGLTAQEAHDAALEFRDYWLAESGQRARKRDWDRTFRNRLRERAGTLIARRDASRGGGGGTGRKLESAGGMAGAVMRRRSRNADGDWGAGGEPEMVRGGQSRQGVDGGGTVIDARPAFGNRERTDASLVANQAPFGGFDGDGRDAGSISPLPLQASRRRGDGGPF